jgi:glycosyltransferase involved in cell wall biosynthesis
MALSYRSTTGKIREDRYNTGMKVVIDGRMLGWTGIGRYTKALLEELQILDHQTSYVVVLLKKDWELWEPSQPNFTRVQTTAEPYSPGEQIQLAWLLYRLRADLVHFVSFNAPILYFKPHVTTVHDLTLVDFKNYRGASWRKLLYDLKYQAMRLGLRVSTRSSRALITPTEYGKQDLVRRHYAPASRVHAIYEGAPHLPAETTDRPPISGEYLLCVGNFYPNKNLARLIEALPSLRQHYPQLKLVLVGRPDVFGAELQQLAKQRGVGEAVVLPGFVTDAQLASYYQHAKLYVFPSLSEGFGLPALEAMARGLPVAAAEATCLPEVLGDAAVYFNPQEPRDIAQVLLEVLANPKQLAALKQAGLKRVGEFSWKSMAEQTLAIYKDILKAKS